MQNKNVTFTFDVKQLGITLQVDAEVVPEFKINDADGDPAPELAYVESMTVVKMVDGVVFREELEVDDLKKILLTTPRPDLLWFDGSPIFADEVQDSGRHMLLKMRTSSVVYLAVARPIGLPQGGYYQMLDDQVHEVHQLYWLIYRRCLTEAGERC